MRKAAIIGFPILIIALIAALAALWPLAALAGPPAQTSGQAYIQGLAFAAFPRSDAYTAGENIRITVKFDRNVTVTGEPKLDINVGGQKRWAAYYHGSGSPNLKFAYTVQASDWDGNGVSVPSGSLALSDGAITSGNNVAASLSHSGLADDARRTVKGSADTTPSFGSTAIVAQTYQKGAAITALTLPAATGGNGLLTYRLAPPDGLVFNAVTRTLSGTPSTTQNATTYTYGVTDANGDTAALSFTITVDGAPSFPGATNRLPAQTYATGTAIATKTFPAASDGNTPLTYSLSPAPPDGLVFNAAARTLSGTPTAAQNAATYTYTVTDSDGDTDSRILSITVDGAPSFPADAVAAQTYAKGYAITSLGLRPAIGGNKPLTYSLTPALPDGLVLDSATITISGTPTTTQNAVTYTYTVTDADGDSDTRSFTITIDGTPSFPEDAVGAQVYPRGATITRLGLPAATDGNTPLTYSLSPAPPDGLVFNAAARTISGAPTTGQAATTYTYTVTDADGDTDTKSFTIAVTGDYDLNDDGLIEIDRLAQLNAIRWDLNGDGAVDTGTSVADTAKYSAAFPSAVAGMGCLRDHDDDAATDKIAGCIGYELTKSLDFDTDGDGATYTVSSAGVVTGDAGDAYYNGGKGWKPIGTSANRFTATFDGAGKTISNLFIKDTSVGYVGLFGVIGAGGRIERLGVLNLNVTGVDSVGGLVGYSEGTISASYAAGSVTGNAIVGGLVGSNGLSGTVSVSYATVSVTGSDRVGGLVGRNSGPISASYATGSVIGSGDVGGLVGASASTISASYATGSVSGSRYHTGGLIGSNYGAVSASYATGSITGATNVGGLVGDNWLSATVSASYATGSLTGTTNVGGLVGKNEWGTISTSYATGSVTGSSYVGGLAGLNGRQHSSDSSVIINSYATGAVKGTGSNVGGLVGSDTYPASGRRDYSAYKGTTTNSYWDTGTTGQATSAGGTGKTTRNLQSLTAYGANGIYANWNANLDGIAGNDDPWDFGTSRQYPVLKYGGLAPAQQRQTAIWSDNWNAPVVGEPVTAALKDYVEATNIAWQWQSSANGSTWSNIANATGATYLPVAADAASGGKFLRAKVTFTASGKSQTLTTRNTAKVVATTTATTVTGAVAFVPPVTVGAVLEYAVSGSGTTDQAWRWQSCTNKEMTSGCAYIGDATSDYRIAAADVGKYLRAYVYYADGAAWKRTTTPVLGPVVAAPAATPTPTPTPTSSP